MYFDREEPPSGSVNKVLLLLLLLLLLAISKSTHPGKLGNQVTVHRPPADRPSVRTTGQPMFTFTFSYYFGNPGENWLHINVVINWQLSKQGIRWPASPGCIGGSSVDPSRSNTFLKLSADNSIHVHWFFLYLISCSRVRFMQQVYARLWDFRQWSDLVLGLI